MQIPATSTTTEKSRNTDRFFLSVQVQQVHAETINIISNSFHFLHSDYGGGGADKMMSLKLLHLEGSSGRGWGAQEKRGHSSSEESKQIES